MIMVMITVKGDSVLQYVIMFWVCASVHVEVSHFWNNVTILSLLCECE